MVESFLESNVARNQWCKQLPAVRLVEEFERNGLNIVALGL